MVRPLKPQKPASSNPPELLQRPLRCDLRHTSRRCRHGSFLGQLRAWEPLLPPSPGSSRRASHRPFPRCPFLSQESIQQFCRGHETPTLSSILNTLTPL